MTKNELIEHLKLSWDQVGTKLEFREKIMVKKKATSRPSERLFPDDQRDLFEKSYLEKLEEEKNWSVKCLGMTFPNDEKRRKYFLNILQEKLKDPEFRKIEGFPIGENEAILALSDPPYYTACPNPFVKGFIENCGKSYDSETDDYRREPYAIDVSEGKTDALYKAHGYHTKVPHLAIVPSILHYTKPGDVVFDGFAGSGMTAVASQWCAGTSVKYRRKLEGDWQKASREKPAWGARKAIVGDLSPAAGFIAANYNLPFDIKTFETAAKRILNELEEEIGWMYETLHTDGKTKGRINYTVWSEVFTCPDCSGEVVFLEEALDKKSKRVALDFPCPSCGTKLTKKSLQRVLETRIDPALKIPWKRILLRPVLINYSIGTEQYEREPDKCDLSILERIEKLSFPIEVPSNPFPIDKMYHGSRLAPKGFTHIHHLFLSRQTQALSLLWRNAKKERDVRLRNMLLFFVEQGIWGMSLLNRYLPTAYSQTNRQLSGVYYVASQISEVSPWYNLSGKLKRLVKVFQSMPAKNGQTLITNGTAAESGLPDNSIDYVFTDPPFGENIYYADLNYLVESWHGIRTDAGPEAIVDKAKQKGLPEYQRLMQLSFAEYYRILKPGRWMTVAFHNSHNAVWIAIQEALLSAGFVVAGVTTMNKQQGSYRQVTSSAMQEDLVVSVYKPNGGLEDRFELQGGTEQGVWDFVQTHLKQVNTLPSSRGKTEIIAERQEHRIYDLMVAFHVQRGVQVPLSAAEFQQRLYSRDALFAERDSMWFLPEQLPEYDRWREKNQDLGQYDIMPEDEASVILWLRQELRHRPRSISELTPVFLRLSQWVKHEKPLELSEMLTYSFLHYDGKGPVPSQIHTYLSSNYKDLRKLEKDDPLLRTKAKDRWYVPDPNKAEDLEKLREPMLLKVFEEYKDPKKKRFKVVRMEAIRTGFRKAFKEKKYQTIVDVGNKLPEKILHGDPQLLMWYDQGITRTGGG